MSWTAHRTARSIDSLSLSLSYFPRALFSSQEAPEDDATLGMLSLKKVRAVMESTCLFHHLTTVCFWGPAGVRGKEARLVHRYFLWTLCKSDSECCVYGVTPHLVDVMFDFWRLGSVRGRSVGPLLTDTRGLHAGARRLQPCTSGQVCVHADVHLILLIHHTWITCWVLACVGTRRFQAARSPFTV